MSISVLIVEDDDATRSSLEVALLQDGFVVTTAADGSAAIGQLKRQAFDVGVLDLMVGDITGLEVLDYACRHRPDTALIMVSGHGSVEVAVEAMKRGAQDFLTKPIDIEKLNLLIHRCVRNQRLERENRRLRQELRERFSVGR